MVQYKNGTVQEWYSTRMVQYKHGTVHWVQAWYSTRMVQFKNGTVQCTVGRESNTSLTATVQLAIQHGK